MPDIQNTTTEGEQQILLSLHVSSVDVGEPSLMNHRSARRFLSSENIRKLSFPKVASLNDFEKLFFEGWLLKNICKTFIPKVWLKIFEDFEKNSKKLWSFLKGYENQRFNQVIDDIFGNDAEWAAVCMVLIKNYIFGGDNCKIKLGLDMLLSQNLK